MDVLGGAMELNASALRAERLRMEVAAANIANVETTRVGEDGGPWRRKVVLFAPALDAASAGAGGGRAPLTGVRVAGVAEDPTPFPVVHRPGHPHADADGQLRMPNVSLAMEMIDLSTAARAYEANLNALRTLRESASRALQIGGGA